MRRGSLPHISHDATSAAYPPTSAIAQSAIMEEPEAPEINFPPSHNEYRFPPIMLNFPPPPQDVLFRSKDDLAPFLSKRNKDQMETGALPSLHSILALQGVSLSDDANPTEEREQETDDIQPPRSYAVRRRMSIDSILE